MRAILKGSVDQSLVIRIVDETDGTPETGVTAATTGLDLKYRREGAATVSLTEANLAALTDAHSDGGMLHIGAGYYRIDVPDAAFAAGADGVLLFGTVTGMVVIGTYVPLVAYAPQDGVRLGLTALPNAAADAAGGLAISDAGGLDLDALSAAVAAILVDTGTTLDGKVDTIAGDTADVAAIKAVTDLLVIASGRVAANVKAIDDSTTAPTALSRSARAMVLVTVDVGATVASIPTSSLVPPAVDDDQFAGRVLLFDRDTTTTALRGQGTRITASTSGGTLTVNDLTRAPVSGDTAVIV